ELFPLAGEPEDVRFADALDDLHRRRPFRPDRERQQALVDRDRLGVELAEVLKRRGEGEAFLSPPDDWIELVQPRVLKIGAEAGALSGEHREGDLAVVFLEALAVAEENHPAGARVRDAGALGVDGVAIDVADRAGDDLDVLRDLDRPLIPVVAVVRLA